MKDALRQDLLTEIYALLQQNYYGLEELAREERNCLGFFITPPEEEEVGRENGFIEIAPGQSYEHAVRFEPTDWVENLQVGEDYMYVYKGGEVRWWDWGTLKVNGAQNPLVHVLNRSHLGPP